VIISSLLHTCQITYPELLGTLPHYFREASSWHLYLMPCQANQHKPCLMSLLLLTCGLYSTLLAQEEDIWDSLGFYFNLGLNDKKIHEHLKDHYDTDIYGFRYDFDHCRMK